MDSFFVTAHLKLQHLKDKKKKTNKQTNKTKQNTKQNKNKQTVNGP